MVGDVRMFPMKSMLINGGSYIIAIICSDCGYILSMNVKSHKSLNNPFECKMKVEVLVK
jgi:hypothetical protein